MNPKIIVELYLLETKLPHSILKMIIDPFTLCDVRVT